MGVLLIHITAPLATDGNLFSIILNQISRFAVPVYFFLSGWGLTITDSFERSESYWAFLKKRLLSILPQYLLWNIIYLVYSDVWIIHTDFSLNVLGELFKGLLLGNFYNHLYFISLIIAFYILYPLLLKISNKYGVLLSLVVTLISQLSDLWIKHEYFYMNQNIFNWLFYFILGVWFAKHFEEKVDKIQKYKGPILLGTVISMLLVISTPFPLNDLFDYTIALASTRPSVIFYSIMIILAVIVLPMNVQFLNKGLLRLSQYSYYIYLSHYLFVSVFRETYLNLGLNLNAVVYIVLSLGFVLGASLIVGVVTRRVEKMIGI